MDWARDHASWPMANLSRRVLCKPHRWHVQDTGTGPLVLLIHGAGGATHSWRHLIPLLTGYRIVAVDLPGQGFSQCGAQERCGLEPMAEDLHALCYAENLFPQVIIGHSAGAAIALRMAEMITPAPNVIGINAALDTFQGVAGVLFPIMAKTIAMMPMAANIVSATASSNHSVGRIIKGTGSTLSPNDLELYRRLVASPTHVNATLQMMAQWNLEPLLSRLPKHSSRALFITGDQDRAVPPTVSLRAAERMNQASWTTLPRLGHLAHEENANAVITPIRAFIDSQ